MNPVTSTVAPMRAISWTLNPSTGFYDVQNSFTSNTNEGNLEVIKSKILIRLQTFQGEWAPDISFGIPFNSLLGNSTDPNTLTQIISDQIADVQNVSSVTLTDFTFTPTTRNFSMATNVTTAYGTLPLQV